MKGFAEKEKKVITLENNYLKLVVDGKGRTVNLVGKETKKDYAAKKKTPLFLIKEKEKIYKPLSCTFDNDRFSVEFEGIEVNATVGVECKKNYFVFEVLSISGDVDEFTFLNLEVKPRKYTNNMSGTASDDSFSFCMRHLNLQVSPPFPPMMQATSCKKYGIKAAKTSLIGCPKEKLRDILKELVVDEKLLHSRCGGPFALDAEENRSSYAFSYDLSESNVEKWIEIAKKGGIEIIHFNGWYESLGSYRIRKDFFPNGLEGLKDAIGKIHAAGLKAGMHCLTGFITPGDPFTTPVPDKRLKKDRIFTLTAALDEKQVEIPILESPRGLDKILAYASQGNVIQIDDELIQYFDYTEKPPYKLINCTRGAFNTKVSSHNKSSPLHHLWTRYGSFYPDENSTLVDEVADCIAKVFNECDFDMIYMDGSEGIGDWYAVGRMRHAIFGRIKKPIRVEASQWGYHSWTYHSVIGAWDSAIRGFKGFADEHCRLNRIWRDGSMMNAQLGWWGIPGPGEFNDAILADDIEYLACKSLANDFPMSFHHIKVGEPDNARLDEFLDILGKYEKLRLSRYFPESILRKIVKPKEEFRLAKAGGKWNLYPVDYITHKVTGLNDGSSCWTIQNKHSGQPFKLRLRALCGVEPYDSKDSIVLADFSRKNEFKVTLKGTGSCSLVPSLKGKKSGWYTAKSNKISKSGAWTRISKVFKPEINIAKYAALGVWVYGDGNGELLNIQPGHPIQYWFCFDEHYIDINFKGWKYFELLLCERDADRFFNYTWPYKEIGESYRDRIPDDYTFILNIQDVMSICGAQLKRDHLQSINIYYNNLPPKNQVKCCISPIKALPVAKVKLESPCITIRDRKIIFPVQLESGQYIEFESMSDCRLYNEKGKILQQVKPEGKVPVLKEGKNTVRFDCKGQDGYNARAKITLIIKGARST
ncbi:hypothetical protein AUJ66_01065 [Candidatus Desantisbacteria bacterium CG1_02_38_46]|uniref:Uncharacterized protein n=2 Tax=unclassified Candidatus Desantisiibacteriota TaxID=3106372 RepID=A0A1J4SG55_9BACT|nr:MAG: hypothetical protein AUJ66_01065 [Candidatus Desantisbacteria bacterium CG1_02_38_46]PIU52139.1 MAG: hypothetical protein COS91_00750 [Candidatus Desantisbacteria bacterium CG07_land_8_20_14_0_80_39_15]